MSFFWNAHDLARIGFRHRANPGPMLMLECYFDDSGTHKGAKVVVWGGVIGTAEQFAKLDQEWKALLAEPLRGKPALTRFHLSYCRAQYGEFLGYSDPESDKVQFKFREVILNSKVMPVAFGVDAQAWDDLVTGELRDQLGGAEKLAFGSCAKAALEIAADDEREMAIYFDQGHMNEACRAMIDGAETLIPEGARRATPSFPSNLACPGLQAADVVANYFYRFATDWIADHATEPEPHFLHLVKNLEQRHWAMFGEDEISDLAEKMRLDLCL